MMKKTKIDWCDFTWNPVTGCLHTCEYCYARRLAQRFCGDVRLNRSSDQLQLDAPRGIYTLKTPFKNEDGTLTTHYPAGFAPTFHEYRLEMVAQKKKPANIFVCSMADLFGDCVPTEWSVRIFDACKAAPWHNFLFLTKNPQRYCELANAGTLPKGDNFWYGTTVTKKGASFFNGSVSYNTFLSIEPLHGSMNAEIGSFGDVRWIIVGAETGNRNGKVKPQREWIENIVETARLTHAAVLLKDSAELREAWGDDLIQEFPKELHHADIPVPHCDECEHLTSRQQGDRGLTRQCEIGWESEGYDDRGARHIDAKYARTSPPWCPKRKEEQE